MGFAGQTFQIPCDKGGLMHSPNIDLLPPTAMVHPTRNINLHEGGRGKRGGTSKINETAVTDTPQIRGIYDFWLKNGTSFVVFGTSDGKIYKNATDTIHTGLTINKYVSFEEFNKYLFACNGAEAPVYWDGSAAAVTAMTNIPSSWTGGNFPTQLIKHGFMNSERLWAIGCPGAANGSYFVYASKDADGTAMADADVISIPINTPDYGGIVGGVEFGDRLVVFSKRHAFIIDDTNSTVSNWGYQQAQFTGGVAHHRLIVKTGNDIICMMDDGTIYSVTSAQEYGDYKLASLTKGSWIHKWIKDYVKLTDIEKFHAVYDPNIRAVKFFVERQGMTEVDTALVYFVDRPIDEAWMVHDNQAAASGYGAVSSALIMYATGDYRVYTGDYDGFLWRLETANKNDDSAAYYAGFKTPPMNMENPRITKRFDVGRVVLTPKGDYSLQCKWWVDGVLQSTVPTVSMAGAGVSLGTFLLGTDTLAGQELIDSSFDLGQEGKRLQLELFNSSVDEDFFVSNVLIDFVPVGSLP